MQKFLIAVHGGAGVWRSEKGRLGIAGVRDATRTGFEILKRGESALDAVEASVACMEDNEVFNAGLGSALAIDKRIEMEASIMDGKTLNAGAVGLLKNVKNPVSLARIVMEATDHVFIVADGAEKLAELFGLERRGPLTQLQLRNWHDLKDKLMREGLDYLPKLYKLITLHPQLLEAGTVGAVALDKNKDVAAATSTGGLALKFPGRIGDSPLIGCGTYADNEVGACSATGIGEAAIKLGLAKTTCELMRGGISAQEAVESSIKLVNRRMHAAIMGLITVDMFGRVGAAHNSQNLCWAYMTPEIRQPKASLKAKIVKEIA